MILALDPGKAKIGWAVVNERGAPVSQGIIAFDGWEDSLERLVDLAEVRVVVIGDGTARLNIEQQMQRLATGAVIAVVDETGSTVDGWILKRREVAGNPFSGLWFMLSQLFNPAPVDDYAARVLAIRYLRSVKD